MPKDVIYPEFAARFKECRERLGLKQKELTELFKERTGFGLYRSSITRYELGNRLPYRKRLEQWAKIFGVSVSYLVGREESVSTQTEEQGTFIIKVKIFGERFKECRKRLGLSQQMIADHFSKRYGHTSHYGQIMNYEKGRHMPSTRRLKQWAEFFNVSVNYLLGIAHNPHEKQDDRGYMEKYREQRQIFGARVKELREQRGLSQKDMVSLFSKRYGDTLSFANIRDYEDGKHMPKKALREKWAEIFGVPLSCLMGITINGRLDRIAIQRMEKTSTAQCIEQLKKRSALGARIKLCRKRLGLTQEGLSALFCAFCGLRKNTISQNTISSYECGLKMPTSTTLEQFAAIFKVSVEWLLGVSADEKN
ncbi:MAG: helix-turn-helix domain-containing protein [Acidaminococcales bacterium]|jgi:transcriptional regulator with XRE-family HTH domain|nr:helix-turn-helix domain-containing protein [Acidaminococcales bacterium]